jgi:hypothetical protein
LVQSPVSLRETLGHEALLYGRAAFVRHGIPVPRLAEDFSEKAAGELEVSHGRTQYGVTESGELRKVAQDHGSAYSHCLEDSEWNICLSAQRLGRKQHDIGGREQPIHVAHMAKDFYFTQGLFPGLRHQFVIQGSHVLSRPSAHGKHQTKLSTCARRRAGGG